MNRRIRHGQRGRNPDVHEAHNVHNVHNAHDIRGSHDRQAKSVSGDERQFVKTLHEKSVGAVIFRHVRLGRKETVVYLLLHYHLHSDYWEFSRGGMEPGENERQTAVREIREETGLKEEDLRFADGFRTAIHYFYMLDGTRRSKDAVYFLAESKTDAVKLSSEHAGFTWAEYDDAVKKVTYENARRVLKETHDFLASKGF
ncbi:MAG: NUDIX domain-containing protein [Candidatus Aenigmarchaeota archaeon]|nr:NUDIX domain-containing protein [Candidatus Aenigmarchaeota archaeon]